MSGPSGLTQPHICTGSNDHSNFFGASTGATRKEAQRPWGWPSPYDDSSKSFCSVPPRTDAKTNRYHRSQEPREPLRITSHSACSCSQPATHVLHPLLNERRHTDRATSPPGVGSIHFRMILLGGESLPEHHCQQKAGGKCNKKFCGRPYWDRKGFPLPMED